ncbi:AraC family transcriptional regulator [Flavobacterium sp. NRK F7]|uniref:helix-turn-helix domain-containing protein n=1 Tax=Flavobacterium sp. NRK F7 TaxID=2954930 RepID=UPI0020914392|nr:helix-turn-helix domain-containing protein [Flavobacterium sp. NRK F7]MCO6163916.1 helix-turn-helix domain-containing protein [Flavobacterium sp. NRK F7]
MKHLHIKNMVCNRCIMVVTSELEKLEHALISVELGKVIFKNDLSQNDKLTISEKLQAYGFEILDDANSKTIEKIKTLLIDLVQNQNNSLKLTLSDYLAQQLHQDYSKLSNLFSNVEGVSIEKYYILLKIEKVKELIVYDEWTLSEIADVLNYSSVAHLSNQFKKVTGFSPSYFKKMKEKKRKKLDQL